MVCTTFKDFSDHINVFFSKQNFHLHIYFLLNSQPWWSTSVKVPYFPKHNELKLEKNWYECLFQRLKSMLLQKFRGLSGVVPRGEFIFPHFISLSQHSRDLQLVSHRKGVLYSKRDNSSFYYLNVTGIYHTKAPFINI